MRAVGDVVVAGPIVELQSTWESRVGSGCGQDPLTVLRVAHGVASPPRRCGSRGEGPDRGVPDLWGPTPLHPRRLRRLAFIRAASNVGFSLDEIAAELDALPHGRTPTAEDWRRISEDWRAHLERIAAIEALRDRSTVASAACLSLDLLALQPRESSAPGPRGAGRLRLLRRPGAREREAAQSQRGPTRVRRRRG